MPRAVPIMVPAGHLADATAAVGVATGAAVADGDPVLEPPQAVRAAPKTSVISAIRRGLLCVTGNASVYNVRGLRDSTGHYDASRRRR
jgi:hypothetical protein